MNTIKYGLLLMAGCISATNAMGFFGFFPAPIPVPAPVIAERPCYVERPLWYEPVEPCVEYVHAPVPVYHPGRCVRRWHNRPRFHVGFGFHGPHFSFNF